MNKKIMLKKHIILIILISILFNSCKENNSYDLIIKNASILNVETGTISKHKSILILNGKIENIIESSEKHKAIKIIDANNKLVTPSFIDTHIHPTDIFGDRDNAPKSLKNDARKQFSNVYLPYGTTTTLSLGQPKRWLTTILDWQNNPNPKYTDSYTAGGALISYENKKPYIGHQSIKNPIEAKKIINQYYDLGIKYIKLYYRLNDPEFTIAYKTADSLNMNIFGHIGGFDLEQIKIKNTLKLGLKNYEHLFILPCSVLTDSSDWNKLNKQFNEYFGELNSESKIMEYLLEQYRYLDENKSEELNLFINTLATNKVSISTTVHAIFQQFHKTYFTSPKDIQLTQKQIERCNQNFDVFMKYVKLMISKGVELRLGSDIPNGGKVNLSELILLSKYGIPVNEVFRIASYNGAKAMKLEHEIGTLKKGRKANMIIWDKSPFKDYNNFIEKKTIIKEGIIYTE